MRCKRENRRFSGAKSRFSRAADRIKDAASRADELIRGSLRKENAKVFLKRVEQSAQRFPSDTALLKALYLATFEVTKKWTIYSFVHFLF